MIQADDGPNPTARDDSAEALAYTPIHALAERLRERTLTAVALLDAYLDRIRRYDAKLHAYVALDEGAARIAADCADRALKAGRRLGPLHGIPIALKDLVEIEGTITTGGSMFWRERVSPLSATLVQRLRAAGMIVIGKTHMVEFAFGSWGTHVTMGAPWNPWDMDVQRTPGGSSSGSGVAVAAALAPAAIGSDTGGSVRIPAALCGIVGLKTTVGRVSNHGTLALSETLDTIGPLTRAVEDAALLLSALHGPDVNDPRTLAQAPSDVLSDLKTPVVGLRLAVLPPAELGEVDPEVMSAFDAALDSLRGLGARIDTLRLPVSFASLAELTGKIIAAEGYALHRAWIDRDDLPFDPDVRARLRAGRTISAADYIGVRAQRRRLRHEVDRLLCDFDALLLPSTPLAAIPLSGVDQSQSPMSRLTRPINLLDLCALSLPCGFTRAGLPISLQICGRGFEEARILRIGWAFENATDWHMRRPRLP
ncbi:MAG: amidase [Burkholderiales bacterium]|nr:amidase [Burkholderiales bacterium]